MVQMIFKTGLNPEILLNDARVLAELKDNRFSEFYKHHPGFKKWINRIDDTTYKMDADLVNLRMCEELTKFKVEFYFEGGLTEEEEAEDVDCIDEFFMSTYYDDAEVG